MGHPPQAGLQRANGIEGPSTKVVKIIFELSQRGSKSQEYQRDHQQGRPHSGAFDKKAIIVKTALILMVQELDSQANEDCARATYLLHTLKSRGVTWPELWWQPDIDGGVCSFLGIVDKDFDAHATLTILESKEEEERLQRTAAELQTQFKAHKGHRSATAFEAGSSSNNAGEEQSSAGRGGEPGSSSNNHPGGKASPIRKPDVVTRAEENLKGLVAAMLTSGISDDGPAEGSEKKKSRQEKRAEARAEAKDKAKESK